MNSDSRTRVCPTRTDGGAALFAHRVSTPRCQERQRDGYHKCFTCAYRNAYVATHGLPDTKPVPPPVETPAKNETPPQDEAPAEPALPAKVV